METAQELETVRSWTERSEVLAEASAARTQVRWVAAAVTLQAALLGGLGYSVYTLRAEVAAVREAVFSQQQASTQQLAALVDKTQVMGNQVAGLEQLLASSSAEDIIFLKMMVLKPSIDPVLARKIASSIHHHAQHYARDPDLVLSIMAVESAFNPDAVSSVGALGLMQVMPHWKQVLAIDGNLKDPDVSIKYGLQILSFYENMYQDLEMALTAYNRGPGPVDMALVKGRDYKNEYAPRVLAVYERLKKLRAGATPKSERL